MNDRLIIKYEINGYGSEDRFKVWLEITDSTGHPINAHSFYGDVGDEVAGGPLKQIIWDLAADSIYLDIDINVEIFATRKIKPVPVIAEKTTEVPPEIKTDSAITKMKTEKPPELITDKESPKKRAERHPETQTDSVATTQRADKPPETKSDTLLARKKLEKESEIKVDTSVTATKKNKPEKKEKIRAEKSVKTGSELLLSTACPGWGLTRLSGGKPYWLIGVVGYGCIASSYYLNHLSDLNYDKYRSSSDIYNLTEMDGYFNTGKKQFTASNILAISAITLWVADLGLTWIRASKMKRSASGAKSDSFSIGSSYDHYTDTPLISIQYTF